MIDEDQEGSILDDVRGQIELKDITFSYPARPDVAVFNNFNLSIPEGKILALVGSSGSGKSTVVQLLERFYDPAVGQVCHRFDSVCKHTCCDPPFPLPCSHAQEPSTCLLVVMHSLLYT